MTSGVSSYWTVFEHSISLLKKFLHYLVYLITLMSTQSSLIKFFLYRTTIFWHLMACSLTGLLFWLCICFTIRYTLKLLTYKSWMYESRKKGRKVSTKNAYLDRCNQSAIELEQTWPLKFPWIASVPNIDSIPWFHSSIARWRKLQAHARIVQRLWTCHSLKFQFDLNFFKKKNFRWSNFCTFIDFLMKHKNPIILIAFVFVSVFKFWMCWMNGLRSKLGFRKSCQDKHWRIAPVPREISEITSNDIRCLITR